VQRIGGGLRGDDEPTGEFGRACESGMKRLDPEALGEHLDRLFRAAWALCGSREDAQDLVQETIARVLSRPRLLRGQDELPYLMQAVRNTFLTSRRTAGRRPRLVATREEQDTAERRTAASAEEAVLAAQVFPAIARLPESFRLALVAVDIAGLSYGEAARVLGAPEATVTTRLYRARQRVARELDPERFAAKESKDARTAGLVQRTASGPRSGKRPCP
jgi:RNA polymerase sigma-70 factor, ECF subfamily